MEDVWVTGRRHVKISKLYLQALLRRGPNIFVALAWSQVFWLVLEAAAGNENSHGYVRLSSVALYALALHTGGHFLLFHYHRRALGHHAMEFLVDLVTDVIGFAWIDLAEEMLAQVFRVSARTAFMYAVLAFVASLGAMEVGSSVRGLLEWPPEFEGTANELDAGSFALPTSWLVTQSVHIALYGFFYRTSVAGGQGGIDKRGGEVDVRFAASLFLLVYAMLLSAVAARVIGGTVAASTVVGQHNVGVGGDVRGWIQGGGIDGVAGSDLVIRTVEAGGPFRASLSSDLITSSPRGSQQHDQELPKRTGDVNALPEEAGATQSAADRDPRTATVDAKAGFSSGCEDGETGDGTFGDAASQQEPLQETMATVFSAASEAVGAGQARRESLRRGLRAYMRITVGMMVGWGYNMWAQVMFRQEELEFRFGPALGATVYATISTVLGVCVMVRGADRIDRRGGDNAIPVEDVIDDDDGRLSMGYGEGMRRREEERESRRTALRVFHAKRMLVVVGGVSLMVGWAWEEALDLILETIVGDSADAGAIVAKLALAVISTAAVLWVELRSRHDGDDHQFSEGGAGGHQGCYYVDTALGEIVEGSGEEYDTKGQVASNNLLEPLMTDTERDGIQ